MAIEHKRPWSPHEPRASRFRWALDTLLAWRSAATLQRYALQRCGRDDLFRDGRHEHWPHTQPCRDRKPPVTAAQALVVFLVLLFKI